MLFSYEDVKEFISRRFPKSINSDSNWTNGNCYYFSLILKDRFNGTVYYDIIHGHFLTLINDAFFDATGIVYKLSKKELNLIENNKFTSCKLEYDITVVNWDCFDKYDKNQKERIFRDCVL